MLLVLTCRLCASGPVKYLSCARAVLLVTCAQCHFLNRGAGEKRVKFGSGKESRVSSALSSTLMAAHDAQNPAEVGVRLCGHSRPPDPGHPGPPRTSRTSSDLPNLPDLPGPPPDPDLSDLPTTLPDLEPTSWDLSDLPRPLGPPRTSRTSRTSPDLDTSSSAIQDSACTIRTELPLVFRNLNSTTTTRRRQLDDTARVGLTNKGVDKIGVDKIGRAGWVDKEVDKGVDKGLTRGLTKSGLTNRGSAGWIEKEVDKGVDKEFKGVDKIEVDKDNLWGGDSAIPERVVATATVSATPHPTAPCDFDAKTSRKHLFSTSEL